MPRGVENTQNLRPINVQRIEIPADMNWPMYTEIPNKSWSCRVILNVSIAVALMKITNRKTLVDACRFLLVLPNTQRSSTIKNIA